MPGVQEQLVWREEAEGEEALPGQLFTTPPAHLQWWFRVQGSGFRVQGSGFRVQGSGFWVLGFGFWVLGSGSRVQGSGCRVQVSGFRVWGLGFRVWVQGVEFRRGGVAGAAVHHPARAPFPRRARI